MIETIARPLAETPVPRADDPRLRAWIAARLRDASTVHLRGVETHFLAQIPDGDREALIRALETVVRGLHDQGRTAPAASTTPDVGTTPDARRTLPCPTDPS